MERRNCAVAMLTRGSYTPNKRIPLIAACRRVRQKGTRDRITQHRYAEQLYRKKLITREQLREAYVMRRNGEHFSVEDVCEFCLKQHTRWLGIQIKDGYDLITGRPMEHQEFMCKECYELSVWHVKHKWTIFSQLYHCVRGVPRDIWRLIEKMTWITV